MKFSWFHLPSFFPELHGSEAQFYQDMLTETDRAEALGFHAVWCAEHHFYNYGGHIPSVPVLGAAIAQRTKRLRIGSGIALAPLQDPIRLAEEFAMLDCLSGGRLDFGIGRGFQKGEYDAFERNMADSRVLGLIGNFGGLERTKILASLDRVAQYVMPQFRTRNP